MFVRAFVAFVITILSVLFFSIKTGLVACSFRRLVCPNIPPAESTTSARDNLCCDCDASQLVQDPTAQANTRKSTKPKLTRGHLAPQPDNREIRIGMRIQLKTKLRGQKPSDPFLYGAIESIQRYNVRTKSWDPVDPYTYDRTTNAYVPPQNPAKSNLEVIRRIGSKRFGEYESVHLAYLLQLDAFDEDKATAQFVKTENKKLKIAIGTPCVFGSFSSSDFVDVS